MSTEPYIETLISTLARNRDAIALINVDVPWRAEDLLCCIYRYARTLKSLEIASGKLVALWAPNCADALAIRYATNLLGAAACFLSAPPSPEARRQLLQQMAPDLLIVFPDTAHLLPIGAEVDVVSAGATDGDLFRIDELARSQSSEPVESAARSRSLAVIVSSGGSTGTPKGSCRDFATYSSLIATASRPERRQLVNGKLAYLSQVLVDQTLMGGGCVVLRDHFDPMDTLLQIELHQITDLFLVEPQLFELMDHPALGSANLRSLERLVHIGASAPASLRRRAQERLGPMLVHTYGASEEGLVSMLAPEDYSADPDALISAGRPLPSVEVRLRKSSGLIAAPGEFGIIEVRSPATARGYRNQPEQTAATFLDGWYHSGDLGQFDRQGRLRILGRADDIVWSGGRMISPTAIEDILCSEPSVRYAVVIWDLDRSRWLALVQPWMGTMDSTSCSRAISNALGESIADMTLLVEIAKVPLTEQGKPDRAAITELGRAHGGHNATPGRRHAQGDCNSV